MVLGIKMKIMVMAPAARLSGRGHGVPLFLFKTAELLRKMLLVLDQDFTPGNRPVEFVPMQTHFEHSNLAGVVPRVIVGNTTGVCLPEVDELAPSKSSDELGRELVRNGSGVPLEEPLDPGSLIGSD